MWVKLALLPSALSTPGRPPAGPNRLPLEPQPGSSGARSPAHACVPTPIGDQHPPLDARRAAPLAPGLAVPCAARPCASAELPTEHETPLLAGHSRPSRPRFHPPSDRSRTSSESGSGGDRPPPAVTRRSGGRCTGESAHQLARQPDPATWVLIGSVLHVVTELLELRRTTRPVEDLDHFATGIPVGGKALRGVVTDPAPHVMVVARKSGNAVPGREVPPGIGGRGVGDYLLGVGLGLRLGTRKADVMRQGAARIEKARTDQGSRNAAQGARPSDGTGGLYHVVAPRGSISRTGTCQI